MCIHFSGRMDANDRDSCKRAGRNTSSLVTKADLKSGGFSYSVAWGLQATCCSTWLSLGPFGHSSPRWSRAAWGWACCCLVFSVSTADLPTWGSYPLTALGGVEGTTR